MSDWVQVVVALQGSKGLFDWVNNLRILQPSTPPSTGVKHLYPPPAKMARKAPGNVFEELEQNKLLEGGTMQPGAHIHILISNKFSIMHTVNSFFCDCKEILFFLLSSTVVSIFPETLLNWNGVVQGRCIWVGGERGGQLRRQLLPLWIV